MTKFNRQIQNLTSTQIALARKFEAAGLTTFSQAVKAFANEDTARIAAWERELEPAVVAVDDNAWDGSDFAAQAANAAQDAAAEAAHEAAAVSVTVETSTFDIDAVRGEVAAVIAARRSGMTGKQIRRQYPIAKHQRETLTALGIWELLPADPGYTDAQAVIDAALDAETSVFGPGGDGVAVPGSTLHKLLKTPVTVDPIASIRREAAATLSDGLFNEYEYQSERIQERMYTNIYPRCGYTTEQIFETPEAWFPFALRNLLADLQMQAEEEEDVAE